jgi:hypothetical protein
MVFKAFQVALLSIELIVSLCGNLVILFLVIRNRKLQNVPNVLLCGLVTVDILNSVINIPLAMDFAVLKTGNLQGGMRPVIVNISLTFMTLLTQQINGLVMGDRFLCIKCCLKYHAWKSIQKALLAMSTVFLTTVAKMAAIHTVRALRNPLPHTTTLNYMDSQFADDGKYIVFLTMVANVLCVAIAALLTEKEIRKTSIKRNQLMPSLKLSDKRRSAQATNDLYACRTLMLVMVVNMISYLPSVIVSLIRIIGFKSSKGQSELMFFIMLAFSHFSETINPLIYLVRSKRFRQASWQFMKAPFQQTKISPKLNLR